MKNKKILSLFSAASLGCATIASAPALAANEAMLELFKVLRDNGTITQEAHEQLVNAAKADDEKNTEGQAEVKAAAKTLPKVETKGKLEISTPEGDFKYQVGGRLQVDAAWFDEDKTSRGVKTELDSGTEIRRARVHVAGTLWKYWDFKTEVDFAEDEVEIKDAYIANTYYKPLIIQVGNFKEPFSLEQLTSSRFITFMERSLADVFAPERNLGTALYYAGPNWTAAAGAFSEGIDDDEEDLVPNGGEGIGATGRVTFAPILAASRLLHLGGAISWRAPEEDQLRFRQRPEAHIADQRLVDTGVIRSVEDFLRYGGEAAFAWGPFSLQGEYLYTDVNRNIGGDPNFNGWYVYGSWFLTGESRAASYKVEKGAFDRVKPHANFGKGGWGAWEVAARYSSLDLSDESIDGGEEDNLTFGLNWYPNPNIRLTANYIRVLDVEGGAFDGAEPDVFQVRAQVDW